MSGVIAMNGLPGKGLLEKGDLFRPPFSPRYRDLEDAASIEARRPPGGSAPAAVAVATLVPRPVRELVRPAVQLGKFASGETVTAGTLKPVADLVRLATEAEGLARRDDAAASRPIDPLLDLADP